MKKIAKKQKQICDVCILNSINIIYEGEKKGEKKEVFFKFYNAAYLVSLETILLVFTNAKMKHIVI